MYTSSAIDSTTRRSSERTPIERRASSGSLTSESSSSSLETPISYATDPDHPHDEPPRTTRQKVDRRPPSTFVRILSPTSSIFPRILSRTLVSMSLMVFPLRSTVPQKEIRNERRRVSLRPRDLSNRGTWVERREDGSRTTPDTSGVEREPIHHFEGFSSFGRSAIGILGIPRLQVACSSRLSFLLAVVCRICAWCRSSNELWVIHNPRVVFNIAYALPSISTDYLVHYGTFDEKQIGRDRTPDKSIKHLAMYVYLIDLHLHFVWLFFW